VNNLTGECHTVWCLRIVQHWCHDCTLCHSNNLPFSNNASTVF